MYIQSLHRDEYIIWPANFHIFNLHTFEYIFIYEKTIKCLLLSCAWKLSINYHDKCLILNNWQRKSSCMARRIPCFPVPHIHCYCFQPLSSLIGKVLSLVMPFCVWIRRELWRRTSRFGLFRSTSVMLFNQSSEDSVQALLCGSWRFCAACSDTVSL